MSQLRYAVPTAWILATIVMLAVVGVPTARDVLLLWLLSGMLAFSIRDIRSRLPRLVVEWSPFIGVLLIYDLLRGYADGLLFKAHELPQIKLETWLFGSPAPTVRLQAHLWHGANDLHWWDYLAWFIYLTHFLATLVAAAALWTWAHDRFARYATMVCGLALVGFATYVLYPAYPPWLAAQQGNLGESNRIVPITWEHIPVSHFNSLFEHGVKYANNVAAIPSLHAAYATLFSLYLWRVLPRWTRPLLVVYPFAMSWALVYTGEHYIVDCVLGMIYAVLVFVIVDRVFDRREARVSVQPALAD